MPRGDRRGPDGAGPMSGRGMGYCAGFDAPGYVRPGVGRGGGGGGRARAGYGRGMRHGRGGYGYGAYGYGGYGYGGGGPGWDAYGRVPAGEYPEGRPVAPVNARPLTPAEEAEALQAQAEYLEEALKDVQRRLNDMQKED